MAYIIVISTQFEINSKLPPLEALQQNLNFKIEVSITTLTQTFLKFFKNKEITFWPREVVSNNTTKMVVTTKLEVQFA